MPLFRRNVATRHHWLFLLATFLVSFPAASSHAADYYVSTSGNDSNPGTQGSPFKTIQKGAEVAKAGDTVHVLPGNYIETVKGSNFAGIQQRNKGTASNRIRFVSDTRWGAKVSTRGGSSVMWAVMGDFVDIEGFEIDGTNSAAGPGIMVYGNAARILYNHVHHITPHACHGAVGIDSGSYDTNFGTEIIGNLVHDNRPGVTPCNFSGYGIYFASPNGKVMNNIVYNNMLYGIHLWHAPYGTVVSHNLVFNTEGKAGIIFGCGDAPHVQCHNITISNNIIMNNQSVFAIREYGNNDSSNRVMNNIIFGNANDKIEMISGTASSNLIGVDPKIPGLSGGDYHLTAGSPAIDAATTTCVSSGSCVPTEDFWQGARPFGNGYDIGPHEYGSTPGSAPPLIPPTGIGGGGGIGGAGAGGSGAGAGRTSGGLSNCAR